MGIVYLKLKVLNPENPKRKKEFKFLVDSGAIYSVIPEEELKSIGIKPTSYEEFILANGEIIKRAVGNAYFEYEDKIRAAPVIFGEKGVFLLGITTLEALGLMLDPIKRQLKKLPMILF